MQLSSLVVVVVVFVYVTPDSQLSLALQLLVLLADRFRKALGDKADFPAPSATLVRIVEGAIELGDEIEQHVACWNMYNYFGTRRSLATAFLCVLAHRFRLAALDSKKELRGTAWNLPQPDSWVWVEGRSVGAACVADLSADPTQACRPTLLDASCSRARRASCCSARRRTSAAST